MKLVRHVLRRLCRALAIVVIVIAGSTLLVRYSPGYLSDAREMDVRYADTARAELAAEAQRNGSLRGMFSGFIHQWQHGSLGISRQYEVPVLELIEPRLSVTGGLLLRSIVLAWALALCGALLSSMRRRSSLLWTAPAALLLAVPTSAMATLCLIAGSGGPVLVMTLILAARDFKFVHRILHSAWRDPHLLQARAQGMRNLQLLRSYMLPNVAPQLLALATLSIVTALSALVPVEVIFNLPGLGQLAWSAATNRDLPVMLAVTLIMAIAVTVAGMISDRHAQWETA